MSSSSQPKRPKQPFMIFNDSNSVPLPDAELHAHEDSSVDGQAQAGASGIFPLRPAYGSIGHSTLLHTNLVPIRIRKKQLFVYQLSMPRPRERFFSLKDRESSLRQMFQRLISMNHSTPIIMDHHSGLILAPACIDSLVLKVVYSEKANCQWAVKEKREICLVSRTEPSSRNKPREILTIIFSGHRRMPHLTGNSTKDFLTTPHWESGKRIMLANGLESALNGSLGIHAAGQRLYATVNLHFITLYRAGPLATLISEYQQASQSRSSLERFIVGLRITVCWPARKEMVVSGLARPRRWHDGPPYWEVPFYGAGPLDIMMRVPVHQQRRATEPQADGTEPYVTVARYFETHTKRSFDTHLPVVNVGTRRAPNYIPVELCSVKGGQIPATAFASRQATRTLQSKTPSITSRGSRKVTVSVIQGLKVNVDPILQSFGIQLTWAPTTTYSRILPPPTVLLRGPNPIQVTDGRWYIKNAQLAQSAQIDSWAWVYLDCDNVHATRIWLQKRFRALEASMRELGVVSTDAAVGLVVSLQKVDPYDRIAKAVATLVERNHVSFVVGILTSEYSDAANAFHRVCDLVLGVRSLHVQMNHLKKPETASHFLTALKANLKLGGINHRLRRSDLGFFANGRTMVVGISTDASCPDGAGALVASVDSQFVQWPSQIFRRCYQQEVEPKLGGMLISQVKRWAASNRNTFPQDIVIYRDGVSVADYQTQAVKEVGLLKHALQHAYPSPVTPPRITYIFVDTDSGIRFISTCDTDPHDRKGPLAGTVVDRSVTDPLRWDFYLQVEPSCEERSPPAYYLVAWDEAFRWHYQGQHTESCADGLQRLTKNICFLFGEGNKANNLCPPAYYARLARSRGQTYMKPHSTNSNTGLLDDIETPRLKGWHADNLQIHADIRHTMFYL